MLWQSFINIKKYKMFKIKDYLGIILFEMAIQDLCFKKSFLTYSPFLPQASLNNWNKKWLRFYHNTSLCYLSQVYGRAPVGIGGKTLKHFSIFFIWRTNKYLKIKEICKLISFECKFNANIL